MSKMYPCERVDLSFIETAPHRFCNSVDLAITPEQVFEVLAVGYVPRTSVAGHGVSPIPDQPAQLNGVFAVNRARVRHLRRVAIPGATATKRSVSYVRQVRKGS